MAMIRWAIAAVVAATGEATSVYVMLPLDTVTSAGTLKDKGKLGDQLDKMKGAGVAGFMSDCWWGTTEVSPKQYKFDAYHELVDMAKDRGMKIKFVSSFHQCGGNVGDVCDIPLPSFVTQESGIWYKDQWGHEDKEYISLFADNVAVGGRTPLQMYSDWFEAFASSFAADLGATIDTIQVGMGPCGELRYPAYQLSQWSFCGIGAFQCWDDHALQSFADAAKSAGHSEWNSPPTDAGGYNSKPNDASFFQGGYASDYGKFFLGWYSDSLAQHADRVLSKATAVFSGKSVELAGKIAGIHWWYGSTQHAAEVTAGYYNTNSNDGYDKIAAIFKKNSNVAIDFTCLEMKDSEQDQSCASKPQELVQQVEHVAVGNGLSFSGENALVRYDDTAYGTIESYKSGLSSFCYLRLGDDLCQDDNLNRFKNFVGQMHSSGQIVV